MEQSLAISEEQIVALSQTIQRLESETVGRKRADVFKAETWEDEQPERLQELEQENKNQMKQVRRLKALLSETQQEVRESKADELTARKEAESKGQECRYLQEQLTSRAGESNTVENSTSSIQESEQEMLRQEIRRLEQELSMKDEEMTRLAAAQPIQQETSAVAAGSPRSSNLSSSMIHDVSVDDAIVVATVRPLQITPSRRGPSASSTPQKSLAKEMAALVEGSPGMPSPFCEKPLSLKKRIFQLQEALAEKMRKLLCEQQRLQGRSSGQIMGSVNQAFSEFKSEIHNLVEEIYEDAPAVVEPVEGSLPCNEQIQSGRHLDPFESQVTFSIWILLNLCNTSGERLSVFVTHGQQHIMCSKRQGEP